MGEVGRETCSGVHFEYEFRQIELRQAGVHCCPQGREAGRFLHFIEGFDGQVDLIADADDLHGGVRRHPSGSLAIGQIEAVRQTGEFLFRRSRHTYGAADHRSRRLPCRSGQKSLPGIGVADRADWKYVAATERPAETIEYTKPVTGQIDGTFLRSDLREPVWRSERCRQGTGPLNASMNRAEVFDSIEKRSACGSGVQFEPGQ